MDDLAYRPLTLELLIQLVIAERQHNRFELLWKAAQGINGLLAFRCQVR